MTAYQLVVIQFQAQIPDHFSTSPTTVEWGIVGDRDRPKPILLVSAVAETVAETEDTHSAVAEPGAESLVLVSAETVAETET